MLSTFVLRKTAIELIHMVANYYLDLHLNGHYSTNHADNYCSETTIIEIGFLKKRSTVDEKYKVEPKYKNY